MKELRGYCRCSDGYATYTGNLTREELNELTCAKCGKTFNSLPPTLSEEEIERIQFEYLNAHGYDLTKRELREGLAHALSGKIAKPREKLLGNVTPDDKGYDNYYCECKRPDLVCCNCGKSFICKPLNQPEPIKLCKCKCKVPKARFIDRWSHLQCRVCKLPISKVNEIIRKLNQE